VTEGVRTIVVAAGALALALGWLAVRTARLPSFAPDRLVAELRLAQMAALLLVLTAGAHIGFAAAAGETTGAGLDVALAVGFFVLAALATLGEPRRALTTVALGFVGHALADLLHRPGWLPPDVAPRWYTVGCAGYDVLMAVVCYLPVTRARARR
jgi:hypothetical protein